MTSPSLQPAPPAGPESTPARRYYAFNETGNIMLVTTGEAAPGVRELFAEVAEFFAALTQAVGTTIDPETGRPYSLYDYAALERVLSGSGCFMPVSREDVDFRSSTSGPTFSKELVARMLGLTDYTADLPFASSMIASIGSEGLRLAGDSRGSGKVGNIVFVCELLLGMPIVSALVVTADVARNLQALRMGPCLEESSVSTSWKLHRETYTFVVPGQVLPSPPSFQELVAFLKATLAGSATISGVFTTGTNPTKAPSTLRSGEAYAITGEGLGSEAGALQFAAGTGAALSVRSWTTREIVFTPQGKSSGPSRIEVHVRGAKGPLATTADAYSVA